MKILFCVIVAAYLKKNIVEILIMYEYMNLVYMIISQALY